MDDHQFNLKDGHLGGDYESAFESESEASKSLSFESFNVKHSKKPNAVVTVSKELFNQEWSREEGKNQRFHLLSLDAYTRHKKLVNEYLLCYPGATSLLKRDKQNDKTENDVLKANHKFLWSDEDEADTWEQRLAKKYYDKLFKEYCIADLSRFKENKIAMRWRIESEVVGGKGQFTCGNKHCDEKEGLKSWEVNFAYIENDSKKNALVKLRLCPDCSYKLNYKNQRKEIKRKKIDKESRSEKRRKIDDPSTSQSEESNNKDSPPVVEEEIWKEPLKNVEEKSKDEEFEDYLADMLL